jgi:uncharacterized protein
MKISLVRLPKDGLKFDHRYADGELDLTGRDFEIATPVTISGRLDRTGVEVRMRCSLQTALHCPCDRCLRDIVLPVDLPLDLIYLPVGLDNQRSGEIELNGRDLDSSVYENEEIDLDAMVIEQLELSIPLRLVCREDCRGLCPQCGIDLNAEECNCEAPIDPRWEILRSSGAEPEKT